MIKLRARGCDFNKPCRWNDDPVFQHYGGWHVVDDTQRDETLKEAGEPDSFSIKPEPVGPSTESVRLKNNNYRRRNVVTHAVCCGKPRSKSLAANKKESTIFSASLLDKLRELHPARY